MPKDPDTTRPPDSDDHADEEQTAPRFGRMLRDLRESYFTRVARPQLGNGPMSHVKLSALSLIACMQQAGYPISSGTYSLIESGTYFPKNTTGFLAAVRSCLRLNDADYSMLVYLLTYDLVAPRLGHLADNVVRPQSLLADTLSVWRGMRGLALDELAARLIQHGFVPARAPEPEMLAVYLEQMEHGACWQFTQAEMAPFLCAYTQAVGERAREPLNKALAEEVRLAAYIQSGNQDAEGPGPGERDEH